MDVDKAIDAVEKYLREFLLFLISFFWRGDDSGDTDPRYDSLNKSMIFAMLSATMGSYLWTRHFGGADDDVLGVLVDNVLRWISLGLLLYAILRLTGITVHILLPVIATVKVLSVAHVSAVYIGYIAVSCAWMFVTPAQRDTFLPMIGVCVSYAIDLIIPVLYLPKEIFSFIPTDTASRTRRYIVNGLFLVILAIVILVRFQGWYIAEIQYRQKLENYCAAIKQLQQKRQPIPQDGAQRCGLNAL
jgi:hypothetical protein